jgi:single-strand DNA-binding protein
MLNKAMIIGNICQDIELRTLSNGGFAATINVATNRRWVDKNTNEKKEEVEFHRVALFGRTAEIASQYLKKGSKVYIEGRLRTQKWTDSNGVERFTTEIIADSMSMLDSRPQDGANQNNNQPPVQRQAPNKMPAAPNFDEFNDDIPF